MTRGEREIAGNYDGTSAVQLGRTRLATMILGVMGDAGTDETQIKQKALALMHQAEEPVPLDRARKTQRTRLIGSGGRQGSAGWLSLVGPEIPLTLAAAGTSDCGGSLSTVGSANGDDACAGADTSGSVWGSLSSFSPWLSSFPTFCGDPSSASTLPAAAYSSSLTGVVVVAVSASSVATGADEPLGVPAALVSRDAGGCWLPSSEHLSELVARDATSSTHNSFVCTRCPRNDLIPLVVSPNHWVRRAAAKWSICCFQSKSQLRELCRAKHLQQLHERIRPRSDDGCIVLPSPATMEKNHEDDRFCPASTRGFGRRRGARERTRREDLLRAARAGCRQLKLPDLATGRGGRRALPCPSTTRSLEVVVMRNFMSVGVFGLGPVLPPERLISPVSVRARRAPTSTTGNCVGWTISSQNGWPHGTSSPTFATNGSNSRPIRPSDRGPQAC